MTLRINKRIRYFNIPSTYPFKFTIYLLIVTIAVNDIVALMTSLNRYIILLLSTIIVFNYYFTRLPSLSIYTSKHNNISTGIKITVFLSFYSLVVLFKHFYSLEIINLELKMAYIIGNYCS